MIEEEIKNKKKRLTNSNRLSELEGLECRCAACGKHDKYYLMGPYITPTLI